MATATRADVHRLVPDEWETLRALRLRALSDAPSAFLGTLADESRRNGDEWRRLVADRAWLVATVGSRPAGVAAVVRNPESGDCYVESMWVDSPFRRQGVASALLAGAQGVTRDAGRRRLFLWVLAENPAAGEVYRRYGFTASGRRQRVPERPELTEIEYVLELPSVDDAGDDVSSPGRDGVGQRAHDLEMNALRRVPDDVH